MALSITALRSLQNMARPQATATMVAGNTRLAQLFAASNEERQKKEHKESLEWAGEILTTIDRTVASNAEQAEALRFRADQALEANKVIELAVAYAASTSNYFPVLAAVGLVDPEVVPNGLNLTEAQWTELCAVPDSFDPAAQTPAAG